MKPLRFVCCAGALFFAFMAGITAYAINSSYRQLTEVELSFAQRVENDRYAVPRSAVYTDQKGRSWLFLVLEQEGAWGKEYVCKKVYLPYAEPDQGQERVIVSERLLSQYPIAIAGEQVPEDGERVRFGEGDG